MPRATWVKRKNTREWHAIHAIVGGLLWQFHCGLQCADTAELETGEHDKRLRCDTCVGRAIEAMRVGVCLEELQRASSVLWEATMVDVA
jgi:hypothetical protein